LIVIRHLTEFSLEYPNFSVTYKTGIAADCRWRSRFSFVSVEESRRVMEQTAAWEEVRSALQKIWGYPDFRSPQGEIVQSLLAGQDSTIILPTGAGKSICFQLPALLQEGLTIVISPLVALMENQVAELQAKNLPAATLHGEVPSALYRHTLQNLDQLRLLYVSPETLLSDRLWTVLLRPQLQINGLILDEAHCLVQWGETFRPAYRRLGAVRAALIAVRPAGTKIPIAAFTATADPIAQGILCQTLGLEQPQQFAANPHRPNLHLSLQTVWTPRGRDRQLQKFMDRHPGQSGLIYVRTRNDAEELAAQLAQRGEKTAAYHAGLGAKQRRLLESQWLNDDLRFVVCTCAFGMGINKPDVRWVAHYQSPLLLSEYIQEVGRAGRDGKPSNALMLVCEPTGWLYPDDRQRRDRFLSQLAQLDLQAHQLAKKIPLTGDVRELRQIPNAEIALAIWQSQGQLTWKSPFDFQRQPSKPQKRDGHAYRQMPEYSQTKDCRWNYLLMAFGFTAQGLGWRCGHCDRCN
jgi:ATP-dependent DNA helicase RecQ